MSAASKFRGACEWAWKRSAAVVALLLIVAALFIGYRLGRPAPEPAPPAVEHASAEATLYTCSMHPSVRLPDPKAKCPICFMDLIPVTSEGDEGERRIAFRDAAALGRVETVAAARFFPAAEVRLFGTVAYDETAVARLTAFFPARIERLFANYIGVPVAGGEHVAEVYSPELLAAFEELRQAAAAAERPDDLLRRLGVETLGAARERLRLFGLTPEQISAAERGEHTSDRFTIFSPINGVVTELAVRQGDYVETGTALATVADLSRLWLDVGAYESQLPLLRWGQMVRFTVEAHPGEVFEGRISFIEPAVNQRTRTATVRVAVENKQRRLKPGMFATAVVRPRVDAHGAVVGGELAGRWVSPMHPTIVKDGPGPCDICGMDLVPAELLGVVGDPAAAETPLVVPRSAVLFTGRRSVVYVEAPGEDSPVYEGREVELGPRAGEFYIVRDGLREGERVVTQGAFRIDSAMQIVAKPSMMGGGVALHHADAGPARAQVPASFSFALRPVYAAYFDAQEALAADDLGAFLQAAQDLATALGFVGEAGLVGEPLADFRRAAVKLRIVAPLTTIDEARGRFERMSEGAIELQRRFGHRGSETWRLAFCPMAFDDKGALWLQRSAEINNPYFGASMLRCGEIRESFPPLPAEGGHRHD